MHTDHLSKNVAITVKNEAKVELHMLKWSHFFNSQDRILVKLRQKMLEKKGLQLQKKENVGIGRKEGQKEETD